MGWVPFYRWWLTKSRANAWKRFAAVTMLLLVVACASPREKAFKATLKDYQRANRAAVEFARVQVQQLVAATEAFHSAVDRWPQSFDELVQFTFANKLTLDPLAFNDVTFAVFLDGSAQIHYDVNCARFDTPQYKFTQSGSVNVKARNR